jgi:hypothetical protein
MLRHYLFTRACGDSRVQSRKKIIFVWGGAEQKCRSSDAKSSFCLGRRGDNGASWFQKVSKYFVWVLRELYEAILADAPPRIPRPSFLERNEIPK